ncbi:MAG: TIGR01212 family radical SAM protein [Deltaproteobacteria bacterium]|nr:TIGR01212 family radical SAM protein [Deltaproteobacteria bacterium]
MCDERVEPPHRFPGGGRYRRLRPYLIERFGAPAHKVTLRAGFGCPNRDGRIGRGGCIFCSEHALRPAHGLADGPLAGQLESGLGHIQRRHEASLAVAYFQDGSATDAPIPRLRALWEQTLAHPRVVALSVGTRPDCVPEPILDLLAESGARAGKPVWLELGLQCADDEILARLNRNHDSACFADAARRAQARGIEVVAHVILDLPGETGESRSRTADLLNELRVQGVKVHNLHVLEGTPLSRLWKAGELSLRPLEAYAAIAADFLERLSPSAVIHRLSGEGPAELMLAPDWGRDKRRILAAIDAALQKRPGWQGRLASCCRGV